jgi:hypothetical protein
VVVLRVGYCSGYKGTNVMAVEKKEVSGVCFVNELLLGDVVKFPRFFIEIF